MDIKKLFLLTSHVFFSTLAASPFRAETISTNTICRAEGVEEGFRGCVELAASPFSIVRTQNHTVEKMVFAKYKAYEYMFVKARQEYRCPKLVIGQEITIEPDGHFDFPISIPFDFCYEGTKCSDYDLVMIPFVVVNAKSKRMLEEVVCKFYRKEEFVFALYVNLNTAGVSLDFIEGSKCRMLLTRVPRFPYLKKEEVQSQLKRLQNGKSRN